MPRFFLLLVMLLGTSPSYAQPAPATPAIPVVLGRTVRNGLGVSGRPGLDASVATYAALLDQIHIRSLRSPLVSGGVSEARHWEELRLLMQQARMSDPQPRFTALIGAYLNDPATTWAVQKAALLNVAGTGLLEAIEGPNEINNPLVGSGSHAPTDGADKTGVADVSANYRAWGRAIHDFKQAHSVAFAGVTLVAPSIASGLHADYARLPDVSAFADVGNIHFYAGGGRQPDFSLPVSADVGSFDTIYEWGQQAQTPHSPVWLTEAGASTSGNYAADGLSQAKYLANQVMAYFAAGGAHMFIYNLIDPKQRTGTVEDNFGIFHADGPPKPAALMLGALQNLVSLKTYDDRTNATDTKPFTPGYDPSSLTLTRSDAQSDSRGVPPPRALVIAKSDGSTIVAVWNEAAIDDGHGHDLDPPAQSVTLGFGKAVHFRVHDLLQSGQHASASQNERFNTGTFVGLALHGYPLLVELSPAG